MLWKIALNAAEIDRQLNQVCGPTAPSNRTMRRWLQEFNEGRDTAEHLPISGSPTTAITPEMILRCDDLIGNDPRITVRESASELGIGSSAVDSILHDHLHVKEHLIRWVPRCLATNMKRDRVDSCRELLQIKMQSQGNFLQRVVTGDESWFHYYEPESKRSSIEWTAPGSKPPVKSWSTASAGKRMASILLGPGGNCADQMVTTRKHNQF